MGFTLEEQLQYCHIRPQDRLPTQPVVFMVATKSTLNTQKHLDPLLSCPCQKKNRVWYQSQILESRAFGQRCQMEDGSLQVTVWPSLPAIVATGPGSLRLSFPQTPLTSCAFATRQYVQR